MQLKHLPFLFLAVCGICLAGAFTASANPTDSDARAIAARP